uniref:ribosomal protein S7 n=1 Tax=Prosopanche panguanensis TaxID=2952649 RepID=UPI002114404A|nr:ribosomal protein S7 [Prosopanche panguanensis]USN93712.1 ribosomal protein S7 [Prosopanche panguanensis]
MPYKVKYDPIFFKKSIFNLSNYILRKGKKSISYKIIYKSLLQIQKKLKLNPLYVVKKALNKITKKKNSKNTNIKKKSKKVKTSRRQIYYNLTKYKKYMYAHRLLIYASKKRFGYNMVYKLSFELLNAFKGNAINIKDETNTAIDKNKIYKTNYRKKVSKKNRKKVIKKKYKYK